MNFAAVYDWIAQHHHLAGLAVFLIAMAESLAVVGLLVPGVAMMFAAGALVGTGALSFTPICAYAVAGALAGDGVSFWVGWHYRQGLLSLWPFRRYPGMIEGGMSFFQRYGGRSVLFGRFVGPVRGVIPLVAGMLAMPVQRFLVITILSALLWGPAYLLPGMAFGSSIDLASQVTGRLAALLIALLAVLWFTAWLSKRLYLYFRPRTHQLILTTFDLSRTHPLFGRLTAPLVDPNQRDYGGLLIWAALLAATALMVSMLVPGDLLAISLEAWRNPWADYVLTVFAELGETPGMLVFSAVIAGWLLIRERRLAAAHFLEGVGFALALGELCRTVFAIPLVDGPVLNGTAIYGFVAVLLADTVTARWRWLVYATVALLVITIGFARVYTNTGEFTAVCFTLLLALVWLVLLGVAYRRHRPDEPPADGLGWVAPLALFTVGVGLWYSHSIEEFSYRTPRVLVSKADWIEQAWSRLPGYRIQSFGRPNQPLPVQWGSGLEDIRAMLSRQGWRVAKPLNPARALRMLSPEANLGELPVLPHFNQTDVDALRMSKPGPGGRWLIVRFWPSGLELEGSAVPIWLGSVAFLEEREFLGLVKFSEETVDDSEALDLFLNELRGSRALLIRTAQDGRTVVLVPP